MKDRYGRDIEFFVCECSSDSHLFKLAYEHKSNDLYLTVYLTDYKNVFQRLWAAIKYVLKIKQRLDDGHWDTTLLSYQDALRMKEFLDKKREFDPHIEEVLKNL